MKPYDWTAIALIVIIAIFVPAAGFLMASDLPGRFILIVCACLALMAVILNPENK